MNNPNDKYYPKTRFQIPKSDEQYENPYDLPSSELQDLIARKLQPFAVFSQNLATAGSLEINAPGRAIVIYGWETNAPNVRTVNTTAFVQLFLENDPGMSPTAGIPNLQGFPMKHARGYRGPFSKSYIYWTAQSGVSIDIVVHRYRDLPWIDGESAT